MVVRTWGCQTGGPGGRQARSRWEDREDGRGAADVCWVEARDANKPITPHRVPFPTAETRLAPDVSTPWPVRGLQ